VREGDHSGRLESAGTRTGARNPGSLSIIPDGHNLDTPPLLAA